MPIRTGKLHSLVKKQDEGAGGPPILLQSPYQQEGNRGTFHANPLVFAVPITYLFCMSIGLGARDKFLSKTYTALESRMVFGVKQEHKSFQNNVMNVAHAGPKFQAGPS